MKYFTKEWYELCQKISFHLLLEEEKQAETFSEEYFQSLYSTKLNDWLDLQQEFHSYISNSETVDGSYVEYEPFDKEKAIEQFYNQFVYKQEYIKKALPENILKEIVDIRIFVLDKASGNVINAVTQLCEENEKAVNRTIEEYRKYYKKALKSFDKNMVDNIRFHDCKIIRFDKNNNSLILFFNNKGGFTDIDKIVFEKYNVIKQDGLLEDSWWLYDEIYKVNEKYELHVLLQDKDMKLVEFIVSFKHIVFYRNNNN